MAGSSVSWWEGNQTPRSLIWNPADTDDAVGSESYARAAYCGSQAYFAIWKLGRRHHSYSREDIIRQNIGLQLFSSLETREAAWNENWILQVRIYRSEPRVILMKKHFMAREPSGETCIRACCHWTDSQHLCSRSSYSHLKINTTLIKEILTTTFIFVYIFKGT